MSQPTTPTSPIKDMAKSVTPQPSWIPLMKSSLFHQAMKKVGYVSADTDCAIIYGPEPAVFNDGQTLGSTHYHVDACLWKGDIFVDGGTFLVPSKLPEASLECYLVDLDNSTGIHHVALRKVSLRTTLQLTSSSTPNFSSHVFEFSNGEMTAVPRVNYAAPNSKRKTRKTPSREYQWDSSIAQSRPVRDIVRQIQFGSFGQDSEVDDHVAKNEPNLAESSVSTSHEVISNGTMFAPARSDSSIMVSGRVVGRQAAYDRSSLSNFSKSIIHIVPQNTTASTSIEAEGSDAAAQEQEHVETGVDTQTSDESSICRRLSAGSQGSGVSTSTVPTTPSSSTFSNLSFWKLATANLPEVPTAPGKPSYVIEALALEEPKHNDRENTDDEDKTIIRRLSWDLRISHRQLNHWDEIQDSRSTCLKEIFLPRNDLAITEEGRIILAEDASKNIQCSPSPQFTPKPVEALPSFYTDKDYLFDALDVVRIELVGQQFSPLFALDLAPEAKGKQRATDASNNQQFPPVCDETDVEIDIDSLSGKLYLRPKITAPPVVVQPISAATGTNVATGGIVPTQDQLSSDSGEQPTRLEDIDLTAIFNQGATDLDDEEEIYTAPSTIASHIIGSRLAQTLYIPSGYADHVERMVQAQPFIPRIEVEANEYWNLLKATIDGTWYAQGCPKGYLPRRPFYENDSDAKFRELLGLGSKLIALTESPQDLQVGFPVHHYNLINQPVFQESRNPSAVSYWAAMASCWKEHIQDGISWKAVVSSQAAKWVDPCTLDGGVEIPDDLRARENSTALRNFLTGQTTIRYEPWGTWMSDGYDSDQERPEIMSPELREAFLNSSSAANMFHGLQRPYFIGPADRDIQVNDDGTATVCPSVIAKEEKGWENLDSRGSTNLRFVHDGTGQVYSFKGMKESKVWEFLEKHETLDILVTGLLSESKPKISIKEISNGAEAAVKAEPEEPAKIESTKLPEYTAEAALEVGKDIMNAVKARSYELVSIIDDDGNNDGNSDHESIAGAGFDDTDYSSTWAKRPKPEDHPKANMLARFAEKTPRLNSRSKNSGQGPKVASKSKQSQKKGSSPQAEVLSQSNQDETHQLFKANCRLAYWSSCPRRVVRGECDHSYTSDAETEDGERHPDLDRDSVDMIQDYAELFEEACTQERTQLNPKYDKYITSLLGSGALAQMMKFGQGVPRTKGHMMTLLGHGAVESMAEGYGIPRATNTMVSTVPDIAYAPWGESGVVTIPSSNSVDAMMHGRDSTPSTTDSADTPESPILSGRNLSPTKMLSSAIGQPETPPQSPEAAEDLGVWEDDGNGGFESPDKHRPQYKAKDVKGQGDQFDDDVDIFDSETKEAPAVAQAAFHEAMVLANSKAESMVIDRATNLEDESTPVRPTFGVLSPIQENSHTPIQRFRTTTGPRIPWNPNFMWGNRQARFSARKQALSVAYRAAQIPLSAESSNAHSRNSSSSSDAISSENGNTHTRNTSVTTTSSSSQAVSAENGNTHTRNTSLSEAMSIEEEFNEERARWEEARRKGYAASRMAQFDSPTKVPVVLEEAEEEANVAESEEADEAIEVAENVLDRSSEEAPLPLPFDYYEEEAPSVADREEHNEIVENAIKAASDNFVAYTSHYLLVLAIIVAFLWHFV